jgi:hypothetical protein
MYSMPQDPPVAPRKGKTKVTNRNQPPNKPATHPTTEPNTAQDTLAHLKKALLLKGSLIKNSTNTRKYLGSMGLTHHNTAVTSGKCTNILLSLVATSSMKRTNEKIPEKVVNITALLLDDITMKARSTETKPLNSSTTTTSHETTPDNSTIQDLRTKMETNLDSSSMQLKTRQRQLTKLMPF